MKKLIGRITGQDNRTANIFYNGVKRGLNAEFEDGADEDVCYTADNLEDAYKAIKIMWSDPKWNLEIVE